MPQLILNILISQCQIALIIPISHYTPTTETLLLILHCFQRKLPGGLPYDYRICEFRFGSSFFGLLQRFQLDGKAVAVPAWNVVDLVSLKNLASIVYIFYYLKEIMKSTKSYDRLHKPIYLNLFNMYYFIMEANSDYGYISYSGPVYF